jgi:ferredoxin, 2Fe-2S
MPKVRFTPDALEVDVPEGTSLLEAARAAGAPMGSACGGNLACSTCHCWVKKGFDSLSDQEEGEDDILDKAFDVRSTSRLGCQAKLSSQDVEVELTRESRQAFYDEHPEERKKQAG